MAISQLVLVGTIFGRPIAEARLSTGLMTHLRSGLYDHLQHVAFSFYDRVPSNRLTGRLLKDLDTVGNFLKQGLISLVEISVSMLAYFALLFSRSPYLAAAVVAIIPVWYVLLAQFQPPRQLLSTAHQDASYEEMMTAYGENMAGKQRGEGVRHRGPRDKRGSTRSRSTCSASAPSQDRRVSTRASAPCSGAVAMLSHLGLFAVCAWLIRTGPAAGR